MKGKTRREMTILEHLGELRRRLIVSVLAVLVAAVVSFVLYDAIIAVLSTGWGRKQPRNMREILETMKVNALHFPIGTVKGRLTDLTKKGRLRRIRGAKGYSYVVV